MTVTTFPKTEVPLALRAKAELELRKRAKRKTWPEQYTNKVTGKVYAPHNEDERVFVYDDRPRWSVLLGGEGAGKSCAGISKVLSRLRRGCDGLMASPDLPHFIKSLWPEFVAWCPWEQVIEKQRYRGLPGWEPHGMFTMVFYTETGSTAKLYCGGMAEEDIESWMGANLNFAYVDEIRRHRTPVALKVLDGRIRRDGPKGEPPQLWFTTVPRMNWLHDYFRPPGGGVQTRTSRTAGSSGRLGWRETPTRAKVSGVVVAPPVAASAASTSGSSRRRGGSESWHASHRITLGRNFSASASSSHSASRNTRCSWLDRVAARCSM